jgi:hypothetical protein
MTALRSQCLKIARNLRWQATIASLSVGLSSTIIIATLILYPSPRPLLTALLALFTLVGALVTLALSVLLWFDAALFTLMASYPDEISAGRAVDDFLARTKLKPLPDATRPLSGRIAGTKRLMRRQLRLAAATAILAVLAFAANFA